MTARTVLLVLGTAGAVCLTGGAAFGTVQAIARQDSVTARALPTADRYVVRTGGRLEVRRGPLELEVSRSWSFLRPEVRVREVGDEVRVDAECAAPGPCDVDLVLSVPAGADLHLEALQAEVVGTRGALDLTGHGGDVEVTRHTGALTVDAHGGHVLVRALRGDLRATSRGGDVRATGLLADHVRVRAFGGTTELGFAGRPSRVDAESLGGDVELQVPEGDYDLDVETRAGHEDVGVPDVPGADAELRLVSTAGDVVVTAG